MCLAQGQNAATPVRCEPVALRSRVKHSTTEPLHSLVKVLFNYSVIVSPHGVQFPVSCKANHGDRNQLGAWLDSDRIDE